MLRLMRRELDTAPRNGLRHQQGVKAAGKQQLPTPTVTAPVLDPTANPYLGFFEFVYNASQARQSVAWCTH